MIRILHIARYATVPVERRVMLMAAEPDLAFHLLRPRPTGGPFDAAGVRDPARLCGVRTVRVWRPQDPHRALYATLGFGAREARPDLIHAEEEPDSLAALHVAMARRALAPGARLVLHTWQNVNRRKRPWVAAVLRRTLAAADAVVCGNGGAVALLRRFGYARPAPLIPTLALDPSIFSRRPVARLHDAFTVAFVGRLAPEKGVDVLVRAVARLGMPARLVVAGTGPCRDELAAQARSEGLAEAVQFVGARDPAGVAALLSAVDVLVLPSRSTPVWQEQFGRVLVEAMGCGTPVVASRSGAIPEVVGEAALLFPEDDAEALAAHLRRLRDSGALRADLGARGRAWALTEHGLARRATQTACFYRRLIGQPAGGGR
jgi:glycosyltransferase involved in cell wall biosynthesis